MIGQSELNLSLVAHLNLIKVNHYHYLFRDIIKEWGCFATEKIIHREGAKSTKERRRF